MQKLKNDPMEYRRRMSGGKIAVYSFLPLAEPYCNSRCTNCFILSSDSMKERIPKSEERIISEIKTLRRQRYGVILNTTEVLAMERYDEILQAADARYILTNGRILLEQPGILGKLKEIGVEQITVTLNLENSGLRLVQSGIGLEAAKLAIRSGFSVMDRITVTAANCLSIVETVEKCISEGIRLIQFNRYIDILGLGGMLDEKQTESFFCELREARKRYPYQKESGGGVYISASGTFGSRFRDRKFSCTAGANQVTIGVDNYVYPCIFMTNKENRVGRFEGGRIWVERYTDRNSDTYECPAYLYWSGRKTLPRNETGL